MNNITYFPAASYQSLPDAWTASEIKERDVNAGRYHRRTARRRKSEMRGNLLCLRILLAAAALLGAAVAWAV